MAVQNVQHVAAAGRKKGLGERRRCLHLMWPDLLADNVFILLYEVKRMQAPTRPRRVPTLSSRDLPVSS